MNVAVRIEATKLLRSRVGICSTVLLVLGMLAIVVGMMASVASGNPQMAAKLGGATADWAGLLGTAAQVMAAGGLLGLGVVAAWIFAREFGDGTITGLFALPVGLGRIAAAKLVVYATWAGLVAVLSTLGLVAAGLLLGFGAPDADVWAALVRLLALGLLTVFLTVPVALVATLARSLLAGVATAVLLVVVAQIGVSVGAGGWMPLAAPALWAASAGAGVSAVQLALPIALGIALGAVTVLAWHRLQLDR